jgi:HD-like signal output (HDOD) protein
LFEECGKAVLYRHAPDHYKAMLRAAHNDTELASLEAAGFGVSHDALGAALCESWGLGPAAVASVRHHVVAQATRVLPEAHSKRAICALSVWAQAIRAEPDTLEALITELATQADLDALLVLRAARQVQAQRE